MKRFIIMFLLVQALLVGALYMAGNVWGDEEGVPPCPKEWKDGLKP